ncbi:DUF898 family protein [Devosia limi]|nr:DUF898 family protein [Devosia limi]
MDGMNGQGQPVAFTGTRRELGAILLRGYLLMVLSIGIYRFWLTTWKRRFYWSNTEIGGEALEYTGNAMQLLLGFLQALAIFIPLYSVFFYLSTQSSTTAVIGYGAIAVGLWFLAGYAIYRARDFRLSRTLWRGIRFDQGGSAWGYAFRRFGWSILMLVTAGLVYPFMAGSLWRYRYANSWYGDRQFGFTGSWKSVAKPYYLAYLLVIASAALALGSAAALGAFKGGFPSARAVLVLLLGAVAVGIIIINYQAREMSRMFSAVRLGAAALAVKVEALGLLGQYVRFGLALAGAYIVLAIGGFVVLNTVAPDAFADGQFQPAVLLAHLRGSAATILALITGYLLIFAAFTLMSELFLGLGYWKLVASGTRVYGLETLASVRARDEDKALVGEGLADALNVGGY